MELRYAGQSNVGIHTCCFLYYKTQLISNAAMPIMSHFRDIFSNTRNIFGSIWLASRAKLLSFSVSREKGHHKLIKMTQPQFSLNSHFLLSAGFITNYLKSPMNTASVIFLQVQMERLNLVIVLGKLSCKSFQEFYAPFLLNSFLEQVPILHICSFFLLPILVPRFPVYLFRQSGYYFSQQLSI